MRQHLEQPLRRHPRRQPLSSFITPVSITFLLRPTTLKSLRLTVAHSKDGREQGIASPPSPPHRGTRVVARFAGSTDGRKRGSILTSIPALPMNAHECWSSSLPAGS